MPIYCDESGGIGRGVMTLAAVTIECERADALLAEFRERTGHTGELKGSRIDLPERAVFFDLFAKAGAKATVGIAISALKTDIGQDKGDHDIAVYSALLDDVVGALLVQDPFCAQVTIDDGRYGPLTLALVRSEIAALVGPCGLARMELSHRFAGLQIADVVANTFFNRALVNDRQARMAATVQPFLDRGQIIMRLLSGNTQGDD
jgi:Protein of unknown function (DUF3800)